MKESNEKQRPQHHSTHHVFPLTHPQPFFAPTIFPYEIINPRPTTPIRTPPAPGPLGGNHQNSDPSSVQQSNSVCYRPIQPCFTTMFSSATWLACPKPGLLFCVLPSVRTLNGLRAHPDEHTRGEKRNTSCVLSVARRQPSKRRPAARGT
jgi:hypothetical protein